MFGLDKSVLQGELWAPDHTTRIFDPLKFNLLVTKMIPRIRSLLRNYKANAIAVSGHSGLMLAGALGYALKVPVFAIRKNGDPCHDSEKANGFWVKGGCRYIVIDDLIASGNTVNRIITRIKEKAEDQLRWWGQWNSPKVQRFPAPIPVAVFLYKEAGTKKVQQLAGMDLPVHYLDKSET